MPRVALTKLDVVDELKRSGHTVRRVSCFPQPTRLSRSKFELNGRENPRMPGSVENAMFALQAISISNSRFRRGLEERPDRKSQLSRREREKQTLDQVAAHAGEGFRRAEERTTISNILRGVTTEPTLSCCSRAGHEKQATPWVAC